MRIIWDLDGIEVTFVGGECTDGITPRFVGFAFRENKPYEWHAYMSPLGYTVEVTSKTGRTESFQGATYNLGLEVATAVRRSL